MDCAVLERYEYKAPGYTLKTGVPTVDASQHAKQRRFYYDNREGIYKSNELAKDSVTLLLAGDLLCQERISEAYRTDDGRYDFSAAFEFLAPLLGSVDFAAGNLETPISHTAPLRGELLTHEGPHYYNSPVSYLAALSGAGFDMLTTENNHALDAGVRGMLETLENIDRFGFIRTDGSCCTLVDICGFKVGFTAFGCVPYNTMQRNLTQEGRDALLNAYSPERAAEIYDTLKAKGAEYVICFPHWGKEYSEKLTDKQIEIARELTGIGYDLVAGAHPHVVQSFKLVNGKHVVFSMGNLLSSLNTNLKKGVEYSVLCLLTLQRGDDGLTSQLEFIPCKLVKKFHGVPFTVLPVLASLGLSEEDEPTLEKTTRRVAKRLECKPSRIRTDLPLTEAAARRLAKQEDHMQAGLAHLLAAERVLPEGEEIAVPVRHFWDSFKSYHVEKKNLYKLYDDHAELVQLGTVSEIVTLPAKVEDLPVHGVSGSGKDNSTARLIYLGRRVKKLEAGAFKNFTALESVRLFGRLKSIGEEAFAGCTSLIGMTLPRSLERVDAGAFRGCTALTTVKIPANVTVIADSAFEGCENLTVYCEEGSAADRFARSHNIPVKYMPLSPSALNADDEEEGNE